MAKKNKEGSNRDELTGILADSLNKKFSKSSGAHPIKLRLNAFLLNQANRCGITRNAQGFFASVITYGNVK